MDSDNKCSANTRVPEQEREPNTVQYDGSSELEESFVTARSSESFMTAKTSQSTISDMVESIAKATSKTSPASIIEESEMTPLFLLDRTIGYYPGKLSNAEIAIAQAKLAEEGGKKEAYDIEKAMMERKKEIEAGYWKEARVAPKNDGKGGNGDHLKKAREKLEDKFGRKVEKRDNDEQGDNKSYG